MFNRACGDSFLLSAPGVNAKLSKANRPLMAYVGTYTSPLQNMRDTQVDLPPGNGRGIHLFEVDRQTGAMTPSGLHEMGTSPSALAFNKKKTRLYSCNQRADNIAIFRVDKKSGTLNFTGQYAAVGNPSIIVFHDLADEE